MLRSSSLTSEALLSFWFDFWPELICLESKHLHVFGLSLFLFSLHTSAYEFPTIYSAPPHSPRPESQIKCPSLRGAIASILESSPSNFCGLFTISEAN